jgi:hypothetical protein
MNGCQLIRAQGSKLGDLQTQVNRISQVVTGLADSTPSVDFAPLSDLKALQTSVSGLSAVGSLVASSKGLDCRAMRNMNAARKAQMDNIFPSGDRSFTMCQQKADWDMTTKAFTDFMPSDAKWVNITPMKVCTPMLAQNGLFGASVMCSDSLPNAMAHAADMRTIRDRCLAEVAAEVSSCTHKHTLAQDVFCGTVAQDKCDTTSMFNGMMCSWHMNDTLKKHECMSSRRAGKEAWKVQCASAA